MIETSRQVRSPEEILNTPRDTPTGVAGTKEGTKKTPVEPEPIIERPLSATVKIDRETFKAIRFVKNTNPRERITFEDGTKFVFPGQSYLCQDFEIATQILKVADRYSIVIQ